MAFRTKRIHDEASPGDGQRVLVDRLWPRGVSKDRAALDGWPKEVTPSDGLRKAFHAGALDRDGFAGRYREELAASDAAQEALETLRLQAEEGDVTLLTAVKEPADSHVAVLLAVLEHG